MLHLTGTPDDLYQTLDNLAPQAADDLTTITNVHSQLLPYQQLALYHLAGRYNHHGVRFLEIGTFHGHSALTMAKAAPLGLITTLNPNPDEYRQTLNHLLYHIDHAIIAQCVASWDFWDIMTDERYDFIFVDGNHARIGKDMCWWQRLKPNGLMLFHDYSPTEAKHPSPRVFDAVNQMAIELRREPDVKIVDSDQVGMAGFVKMNEFVEIANT